MYDVATGITVFGELAVLLVTTIVFLRILRWVFALFGIGN